MFDSYEQRERNKARQDFRACKAVFDALRAAGKTDNEIRSTLSAMLAGKLWKDEVIQELFNPRNNKKQENKKRWEDYQKSSYEKNRKRWEEEARRHQEYRWRENLYTNRSSSLNEALQFFGFTSMPGNDELKRRYRELALKNHPDKGGDTATFQRLQSYKDQLYARAGL